MIDAKVVIQQDRDREARRTNQQIVEIEELCKNYENREVDDGADTADAGIFKNIHLLAVGSSVFQACEAESNGQDYS